MDALDRIRPPARVGERLVVRYRLPDGSATDVIGWVDALGPDRLVLSDHHGVPVEVSRPLVVAARRAPAARGGPDPMRTSAAELEKIALPAWLGESEPLGEWTLRAAGGFTGRANSCLAVGDPGIPLADAARAILSFARAHEISPRAQVVEGSGPELGLRTLGWTETYVRTDVLVARLGALLVDEDADRRVEVSETLTPQWYAAYQLSRPNTAEPRVLRQILEGSPPCGFAFAEQQGRPATIGRGHISAEWLALTSLWTAPEHRRLGWASRAMTSIGYWAARRGASNVYLQVAQENEAAHRAYRRSGFVHHHSYLYLAPPETEA